MWKLAVGFAIFAALAIYILTRAGGNIDLGGDGHSISAHPPASAASASP